MLILIPPDLILNDQANLRMKIRNILIISVLPLFSSFPLLFAFIVGGLGFEFCVLVAGWRHALRSEWPFIIIIITGII